MSKRRTAVTTAGIALALITTAGCAPGVGGPLEGGSREAGDPDHTSVCSPALADKTVYFGQPYRNGGMEDVVISSAVATRSTNVAEAPVAIDLVGPTIDHRLGVGVHPDPDDAQTAAVVEALLDPTGVTLAPGEEMVVVLRIEPEHPSEPASVFDVTVTYSSGGAEYRVIDHLGFTLAPESCSALPDDA